MLQTILCANEIRQSAAMEFIGKTLTFLLVVEPWAQYSCIIALFAMFTSTIAFITKLSEPLECMCALHISGLFLVAEVGFPQNLKWHLSALHTIRYSTDAALVTLLSQFKKHHCDNEISVNRHGWCESLHSVFNYGYVNMTDCIEFISELPAYTFRFSVLTGITELERLSKCLPGL